MSSDSALVLFSYPGAEETQGNDILTLLSSPPLIN